jgi:Fe2+ transport system protein FeoA
MENQRLVSWRGLCNTHRQAQELISGPKMATRARLLSFNRTQSSVVIGFLTGHNNLRRHLYVMGLSNNPTCWKRGRGQLKCDGTRAETRFHLSAKRTSHFKSAGASVQSTTGSRGVRIGGGKAGYTMFRGSVKSTGYPLHSPVSPSLPFPCVTVCHHISTGVY